MNRGFEAAEWIESQVKACETKRLSIEFTIPAKLGQLESLIWVEEFLTKQLACYSRPFVGEDDARELLRLLENSGAVRGIGWSMPILDYLGVNPEGEISIPPARAPGLLLTPLLGPLSSLVSFSSIRHFHLQVWLPVSTNWMRFSLSAIAVSLVPGLPILIQSGRLLVQPPGRCRVELLYLVLEQNKLMRAWYNRWHWTRRG